METVKTLCQNRILAILRGIYGETALRTAEALCCGGVRTVEVTFEADRPETWEQTAETLQLLNREFGQQLLLGAGTVLTCRQVTLAAQAGAQLAVAPNTDAAVIRAALEAGLCPLPGAICSVSAPVCPLSRFFLPGFSARRIFRPFQRRFPEYRYLLLAALQSIMRQRFSLPELPGSAFHQRWPVHTWPRPAHLMKFGKTQRRFAGRFFRIRHIPAQSKMNAQKTPG